MGSNTLKFADREYPYWWLLLVADDTTGKIAVETPAGEFELNAYEAIDLAVWLNNHAYPHTIRHRGRGKSEPVYRSAMGIDA